MNCSGIWRSSGGLWCDVRFELVAKIRMRKVLQI